MRVENVSVVTSNNHTPNEVWHMKRDKISECRPLLSDENGPIDNSDWQHWYNASSDFAVRELIGKGRCLVVGSPIFEAFEMQEAGWCVTYLDVRKPPTNRLDWFIGDASDMPFDDETFDAVSSSCVICHVGLGRYGDEESEDGDYRMMSEIRRVLKPGGTAALSIPVANVDVTQRVGTCHRIYAMHEVNHIVRKSGMTIVKAAVWDTAFSRWKPTDQALTNILDLPDYVSVLLRR